MFVCEQLLKTADSSTSDVSGLHAKLDRKRNVDCHNASVQEKFHVRFHDSIDDLSSHVKNFIAQQEQFSASLCNSFGQSVGHVQFFIISFLLYGVGELLSAFILHVGRWHLTTKKSHSAAVLVKHMILADIWHAQHPDAVELEYSV